MEWHGMYSIAYKPCYDNFSTWAVNNRENNPSLISNRDIRWADVSSKL